MNEHEDAASEHGELIDYVRRTARNIGPDNDNSLLAAVSLLLEREAHLAVRRASEMMADGVPPDSAFFLAVDDAGFQLAHAAAQSWHHGREVDRLRR